jgi:hypothetical protein
LIEPPLQRTTIRGAGDPAILTEPHCKSQPGRAAGPTALIVPWEAPLLWPAIVVVACIGVVADLNCGCGKVWPGSKQSLIDYITSDLDF